MFGQMVLKNFEKKNSFEAGLILQAQQNAINDALEREELERRARFLETHLDPLDGSNTYASPARIKQEMERNTEYQMAGSPSHKGGENDFQSACKAGASQEKRQLSKLRSLKSFYDQSARKGTSSPLENGQNIASKSDKSPIKISAQSEPKILATIIEEQRIRASEQSKQPD